MRKRICLFFFAFLIFGAHTVNVFGAAPKTPFAKVQKMTTVLKADHSEIKSWSIYARERSQTNVTLEVFQKRVRQLKKNHPDFTWSVTQESSHHIEVSGNNRMDDAVERITYFIYPQKSGHGTYLIYEIEGQNWNDHTKQAFSPTVNKRMSKMFGSEVETFASVKATHEPMSSLNLADKARQYSKALNSEVVERINEKTFVSLSAYNASWQRSIVTEGKKMNVQIALRNTGNNTTVTLGTPIITTEY